MKHVTSALLLSMGVVVSAMSGCNDSDFEHLRGCVRDVDCVPPRICVEGVCVDREGSGGAASGGGSAAGGQAGAATGGQSSSGGTAATGGSSSTGGNGPGSGGAVAGDGGPPNADAGDAAVVSAEGVVCGDATCPSSEKCCYVPATLLTPASTTCGTGCSPLMNTGINLACDGAEDCDAGQECCRSLVGLGLPPSPSYACNASCTGAPIGCTGSHNCPGSQVCCATFTAAGVLTPETLKGTACADSCDSGRIVCADNADCGSAGACTATALDLFGLCP